MTKEEKKAQITGFAIDCGHVGYLRASIGMKRGSLVLRGIFPERMWDGKWHGYDFKGNFKMVKSMIRIYAKDSDDVVWAESVLDFFKLGVEKQEKNLKPKVEISW